MIPTKPTTTKLADGTLVTTLDYQGGTITVRTWKSLINGTPMKSAEVRLPDGREQALNCTNPFPKGVSYASRWETNASILAHGKMLIRDFQPIAKNPEPVAPATDEPEFDFLNPRKPVTCTACGNGTGHEVPTGQAMPVAYCGPCTRGETKPAPVATATAPKKTPVDKGITYKHRGWSITIGHDKKARTWGWSITAPDRRSGCSDCLDYPTEQDARNEAEKEIDHRVDPEASNPEPKPATAKPARQGGHWGAKKKAPVIVTPEQAKARSDSKIRRIVSKAVATATRPTPTIPIRAFTRPMIQRQLFPLFV